MTPVEVAQAIARLRRDMPRNALVMSLCDSCEQLMSKPERKPLTRAEIQRNYRERKKRAKSGECHSS